MYEQQKNKNLPIFIGIAIVMVIVVGIIIGLVPKAVSKLSDKDIHELAKDVNATEKTPHKGQVSFDSTSLYDELPDIDKYPLAVEADADVVVEIVSSGEKAGSGNDSWLVDAAEQFNGEKKTLADGSSVGVSVRSLSSGQGGDYIISGKHVPEMYTPSNELFGEYVIAKGGKISLYNERLVGNTAGILVKKNSGYNDIDSVIKDVEAGKLAFGYTNPTTSATGMNFLLTILHSYNADDMFSDKNADKFSTFQENVPYVAYTTMQMREGASGGSLDGMVMEYQQYFNDDALKNEYDFIPFGIPHNNPLYISDDAKNSAKKSEAVELFYNYTQTEPIQSNATGKGFNHYDSYTGDGISYTGSEVENALSLYKQNKDAGRDIVAVFVADRSGSMDGEPMEELKKSLSNGMNYIGENAYVGLVSYSSDVTIDVPIAQFDMNQKAYFQGAIDDMWASGNTSSYEAVAVAADMVQTAMKDHPNAKPMVFLLSDGYANGSYSIDTIESGLKESGIPVYTIGYTSEADADELLALSQINEAASVSADSEDVVYKIKSLFNSNL